ncbi:MAG: DUF1566 domain-containing protein, partial [Deltaproteobacteria bacterium]|nr:DUF1566 domain-containing protein [Deltaproteobacteria bacterium]
KVTPTGGDTSWENAKSHCSRLVLDGGGWRLPTIGELRSLIRGCPATEAGGSCSVKKGACLARSCRDDSCNGCGNFGGPANGCYWPHYIQGACTLYWSSSPVGDDDGYAWHVFFNSGLVYDGYFFVSSGSPVRCVR